MTQYLRPDDALWTFKTARFAVEFHAVEEDMDPEEGFQFAEDVAFARNGDAASWFCAVVIVRAFDDPDGWVSEIIGRDTLGGCSYRSFAEFMIGHRDSDPSNRNTLAQKAAKRVVCHYFPDMVHAAIADARATLTRQAARALKMRA